MSEKNSLFVGRFQPFHLGHLQIIKRILATNETPIIVIGSAQHSNTAKNPLAATDRERIIRKSLEDANITADQYHLYAIDDINDNNAWVSYLRDQLPPFNKIYSGTPLVQQLFQADGQHELIKLDKLYQNISATKIRQLIRDDNEFWQQLVPKQTRNLILNNQLDQQIKQTH